MSSELKLLLLSFIVFMGSFTMDTDGNLILARIYFDKAIGTEMAAENLKTLTEDKKDKALFVAYNGAAYALLAKHVWSPYRKLENLNKGLAQLNRSAIMDPNDVEIRFLRLSVEENIPEVIKIKKHINEDKNFIVLHLKPSHAIYQKIKGYMLSSKSVSSEERKAF